MAAALLSGFSLGLSLILVIGPLNAFVLRQGLRGEHVLPVVATSAVSDSLLIVAGVAGLGAIAAEVPGLEFWLRWAGAAFLFVYGGMCFRRAIRNGQVLEPVDTAQPDLSPAVLTCLAFIWLNPHVYFDTVFLLGSVSAGFAEQAILFGAGACLASFFFYFALGYGAQYLRGFFGNPVSWRILDGLIGVVMWVVAFQLVI